MAIQLESSFLSGEGHDGYGEALKVALTGKNNSSLLGTSDKLRLDSVALFVDYIFLDTDERRRFAQLSHEYLIEQLQFTGSDTIGASTDPASMKSVRMTFNHPCKELIWTVHSTDSGAYWNNFSDNVNNVYVVGENPVDLQYQVASDIAFTSIITTGFVTASSESGFTVKVDAKGLRPGRSYFYRFRRGEDRSPVGTTRTLPDTSASEVRFAVLSCSNYPAGYFNVYAEVAKSDAQ
ncbi:MAG: hypothetical protein EB101_13105, partial [Chitinophagia bacterium]|nr:hypothetical protein [Chitinophagia bacterium]